MSPNFTVEIAKSEGVGNLPMSVWLVSNEEEWGSWSLSYKNSSRVIDNFASLIDAKVDLVQGCQCWQERTLLKQQPKLCWKISILPSRSAIYLVPGWFMCLRYKCLKAEEKKVWNRLEMCENIYSIRNFRQVQWGENREEHSGRENVMS